MSKLKHTPGPWRFSTTGMCVTTSEIGVLKGSKEICKVSEFDKQVRVIHANAKLIAAAPELLEALIKAKKTICSLKLSMAVHPDCEEGSEFDDYTSTAQEVEDVIEKLINKATGSN